MSSWAFHQGRWATVGVWLTLGILLVAGFARASTTEASIFATRYPLAYFAQRIGGPEVRVVLPNALADGSPWRPTLEDIQTMQRARIILTDDPARESWLDLVALRVDQVVDTTENISGELIPARGETTHTHGPTGSHSHGASAENPWLDPTLAVAQAKAIAEAMGRRGLADGSTLDPRLRALETDLLALDGELQAIARDADGILFLAAAPAYEYLARRYGLRIQFMEWEAAVHRSDATRQYLEKLRRDHRAIRMIWPEAPAIDDVAFLREAGIDSLIIDPLSTGPENGDFLTVMQRNAEELRRALDER